MRRTTTRRRRHQVTLAIALAAATTGLTLVNPSPAAAASDCWWPLCGTVKNNAHIGIRIARDWCSSTVCSNSPTATLQPGQHSDRYYKDTDAFQVPPYCTVSWGVGSYRAGGSPVWIRIRDYNTIYITSVNCAL